MSAKSAAKVGINGFGRIGRMILRAAYERAKKACGVGDYPQIVSINDPYISADHMACLLKHDSTHGIFEGEVMVLGNCLKIDGQLVEVTNEKDPTKIGWNKSCAKYVVDATGLHTTLDQAQCHLRQSVKRVLVTAISPDIPMFIVGVNDEAYCNEQKVISTANCTMNCLAPLAKVVNENWGIDFGLLTAIHAVTASQNVVDGPSKRNWRKGRGALQNIIPTPTFIAKAMSTIMPELDKKIAGIAVRVPVSDGSMLDLTVKLCTEVDYEVLKCQMKEAAETHMKGILGYTDEQVVSSDIIGDSRSCVFDATAGLALNRNFVKLVAWYDNEWAYACRVVDMLKYMASREDCE